ncbi:peptide ABC transporter ATP-binding protein [Brevibacillus reuszeri]|uniref:Nickel ABC transporter ATP-binding protein n=1 Tax=Brevibacillus reuszeri TaxID=54915 RepID=A0A0K9YZW9_9BACL|nr:ABC transporter ATP-binding protein [Brevibacillus reuszeri]KNB74206.1 nickel ABC transporter ATP-binding protein [Brevibacillus reuszeri]MED1861218.1 ABC transporter ATP-binding protein [Brevibacillus reuszeri]GED73061.1 peptide ABC transporter ATP-binding protein [Brevibacillus reuszeri]
MNKRDILLDVNGLNIQIHTNHGQVSTVRDVSFQIMAGKVLGIVGESGCGKSLTCLAILQLLQKHAIMQGSIRLQGRELTGMTSKQMRNLRGKDMCLIMQNPMNAFNPVLSIEKQFVETIRTHTAMSKIQAKNVALECLKEMNLPDPEKVLERYPFELSGGMLQRVMIALSIAMRPALLIADEPTTALDNVNRRTVVEAFRKIKKEGETAILLVSHDLEVINELADEVAVMKQGEIVEIAPATQLFTNPKHEYTKLLLDARMVAESRIG